MTYEEAIEYIHGRPRFSGTAGLGRIRRLLAALGNPETRCRCVHIAGTNGKGSTAAFTAAALRAAGCRTGLYTSPFLVHFEERFQIDGVPIAKDALAAVTEAVKRAEDALEAGGMEPVNEFELNTAIGFLWFSEQNCDYVVLEVGLGGRCDATNVIANPACTCITSISLDHMAQLGSTVAEIAAEKAGIIKEGCPVVTPAAQAPEALAVIQRVSAEKNAPLYLAGAEKIWSCDRNGAVFQMDGETVSVPLLGRHQIDNAAAGWRICRVLGLAPAAIRRGFAQVCWPGRLQVVSRRPLVLLDCAHNEDGVETLARNLETLFADYRPVFLMTMMADKAHGTCIRRLSGMAARLYATTLPLPRAMTPEAVAAEARCPAVCVPELKAALAEALGSLQTNEMLVVCGSVYLVGAALPLLEKLLTAQTPPDGKGERT